MYLQVDSRVSPAEEKDRVFCTTKQNSFDAFPAKSPLSKPQKTNPFGYPISCWKEPKSGVVPYKANLNSIGCSKSNPSPIISLSSSLQPEVCIGVLPVQDP